MPSALETLNKLNWVSKTLFLSHLLQLLLFMMRIVSSYVGFSSGVQFGQTNSEIADQKICKRKCNRGERSQPFIYTDFYPLFQFIIPDFYWQSREWQCRSPAAKLERKSLNLLFSVFPYRQYCSHLVPTLSVRNNEP